MRMGGGKWTGYVLACSGLLTGWLSGSAAAQDWALSSGISQRVTYNSNLLLTPSDRIDAFGSLTTPELTLSRSTPTSHVTLDGTFKFAEYINHSDLNTDGQLVNLNIDKDLTERSTVSLQGDFNRDSTLTSDHDIDGRFLASPVRFITWDVAPAWTYLLSPIDRIDWQASYQSTSYEEQTKTDYEYYGTALDYAHQLTELSQVTGGLSYFRFAPDDTLNTHTDIYGFLVGYRYKPTERFLISGSVGMDYNVTSQDRTASGNGGDKSEVGYRLKFDMSYALTDQTRAELTLSHDSEPTGDGDIESRNRANLAVNYQFGDVTSFQLIAVYSDTEDYFGTENEVTDDSARYYAIGPSVSWDLNDDLQLQASYQLRYKTSDSDGSATDNAAFITLRYDLPDVHWSGF
jgi:hypothetical protein